MEVYIYTILYIPLEKQQHRPISMHKHTPSYDSFMETCHWILNIVGG